MELHVAAVLALALLASATAGAAAAAAAAPLAAPSACPSLLTLLGAFPNNTVFADVLQALGATTQPVTSEPPLPAPGSSSGTAQPAVRRLKQDAAAATAGMPMACPAIYLPVCGTNNQTYGNECSALSMGATVACKRECPCANVGPSGSLGGVCSDIVEPVCGADGRAYANSCFAQVAGVAVSCKSACPCPDLINELERGGGGLLLVPTDEALLLELDALNATGIWEDDTVVLKQLLARHVVLTDHQKGLGGEQPRPSSSGTAVVTEAGQRLTLYSGTQGAPGRVQSGADVLDSYTILSQTEGCNVTALQIDGVLAGLPSKAT